MGHVVEQMWFDFELLTDERLCFVELSLTISMTFMVSAKSICASRIATLTDLVDPVFIASTMPERKSSHTLTDIVSTSTP